MIYVVDTDRRTLTAIGIIKATELRRLESEAKKRGAGWEVRLAPAVPMDATAQAFNAPVYPEETREPGFRYKRKNR